MILRLHESIFRHDFDVSLAETATIR